MCVCVCKLVMSLILICISVFMYGVCTYCFLCYVCVCVSAVLHVPYNYNALPNITSWTYSMMSTKLCFIIISWWKGTVLWTTMVNPRHSGTSQLASPHTSTARSRNTHCFLPLTYSNPDTTVDAGYFHSKAPQHTLFIPSSS